MKMEQIRVVSYVVRDDTNRKTTSPKSIKEAFDSECELSVFFKDGGMEFASDLDGKVVLIDGEAFVVRTGKEMKWRVKGRALQYNSGSGWYDAGLDDPDNLKWIADRLNGVRK